MAEIARPGKKRLEYLMEDLDPLEKQNFQQDLKVTAKVYK